jgi:nitrate reductase (NAD(P)H)
MVSLSPIHLTVTDFMTECILGVVTEKAKKLIAKDKEEKEKNAGAEQPPDQALQKHRWVPATLKNREWVTDDTAVYTFELPKDTNFLGLGTCQHIDFGFHLRDRMLIRPYTPTKPVFPHDADVDAGDDESLYDGSGRFQLTVKTYFANDEQPGGALSSILAAMSIGEWVDMRGPTGNVIYKGKGKFIVNGKDMTFKKVSLVVGGTGLTPGYSLLARIVLDPDDETEVRVIDANKSEDDILLQKDLQQLVETSQRKLKITHILSHPSDEWTGESGLVNKELMQSKLFPPSDDSVALLCGPPPMIQKAVVPALREWGYDSDNNMFGL